MAECRSCSAQIIWAQSATSDKRMPLDAEPVDDGNVVLELRGHAADPLYRVLTKKEKAQQTIFDEPQLRYKSHFATCPQDKQWRR